MLKMVKSCARCGQTHEVEFFPLDNASDEWDHWADCPVTHQPIMMREISDSQEESAESEPADEGRDRIKVPTIDAKRYAEIQKRCQDAQFGYTRVGFLEYYVDVKLLLEERQALLEYIDKLREVPNE